MRGNFVLLAYFLFFGSFPSANVAADTLARPPQAGSSLYDSLPADLPQDWSRYALVTLVDVTGSAPVYAIATTGNDLLDTVYFVREKQILLKRIFKDERLGPDGQIRRFYSTPLAGGGAIVDVDVYSGEAGTRTVHSETVQHQFYVDPIQREVKEVMTLVTEQAERSATQWKKRVVIPRREVDPNTNLLIMYFESNGRVTKRYAWDSAKKQWRGLNR